MKKILITHIPNTLNYGSAMMAINVISGLRKHFTKQDLSIYCECDDYHLSRLKEATGDNSLMSYFPPDEGINTKFEKVKKYLFGKSKIIESISSHFSAIIVLGGDDLSESEMRLAVVKGLFYYQLNKKCKVILAGQSLGPFSGIYKEIASLVFKNLTVITRDDNSYKFCTNELKLKNVIQSRDLALNPLPKQDEFSTILEKEQLSEKKYIVVVPSGLVKQYTEDIIGYTETWLAIVDALLKRYPEYKIVMLGHVLAPQYSSDSLIIAKIVNEIDHKDKSRITTFTVTMQPAEARAILGSAQFVITGRMHAAVSTLYMGKPAVALAYSEKYNGVISKGLGLPELVVDCRNREWGENSSIISEVMKRVENIETNYIDLSKTISKNIGLCSKMVDDQIKYIAEKINE